MYLQSLLFKVIAPSQSVCVLQPILVFLFSYCCHLRSPTNNLNSITLTPNIFRSKFSWHIFFLCIFHIQIVITENQIQQHIEKKRANKQNVSRKYKEQNIKWIYTLLYLVVSRRGTERTHMPNNNTGRQRERESKSESEKQSPCDYRARTNICLFFFRCETTKTTISNIFTLKLTFLFVFELLMTNGPMILTGKQIFVRFNF